MALASCNRVAPDGVGNVFNVASYGAKPDGSDAYPGIQAAINAACAAKVAEIPDITIAHPAVYLPEGTYKISRPLTIGCNDTEVFGACREGVVLAPQFQGPAIMMSATGSKVTTGPAIVGTGKSGAVYGKDDWKQHLDLVWHLNLRDMPAVELDRKKAFTAETFVQLTENRGGSILTSLGCTSSRGGLPCHIDPGGNPYGAFNLGIVTVADVNYLTASILTDGGLVIVGGPFEQPANNLCPDAGSPPGTAAWAVSRDQLHHVAMSYDSEEKGADGKPAPRLRLFLDGRQVVCKAASGLIAQAPDETVSVGPAWYGMDDYMIGLPVTGSIDSVRLSDVSRYRGHFTKPAAQFSGDASTLALVNFEDGPAPPPPPPGQPPLTNPTSVVLGNSRGKDFWLPVRSISPTAPYGFLQNIRLHDFTISGGMGAVAFNTATSQLWQLSCLGCDYGFAMLGNSWGSAYDDLEATAGGERGRFGLVSNSAGGNEFHNLRLNGQTFPFVIVEGSINTINDVTITASTPATRGNAATVYGMYLDMDSPVIHGVTIDASGSSTAWRGAIAAVNPWSTVHVQHGRIGNMANPNVPASPIFLQRNDTYKKDAPSALIQGTTFTGTASAPEIVHVYTDPSLSDPKPTVVLGATKDSAVPWSNDPLLVTASDPSTVPAANTIPPTMPGSSVVRGQVPANAIFDVTKYGAVGDGVTDSSAGIQKAVDAACASQKAGTPSTVFFPVSPRVYRVGTPVLVHCDGVTVEGAHREGAKITPLFDEGPSLVMEPAGMTGLDLVPGLLGSGQAMKTNGGSYWLELRDANAQVKLSGSEHPIQTKFTVDAVVKVTAPTSPYGGIVQSKGCLGSGGALPGCTSAFSLGVRGQTLVGSLNIDGTSYPIEAGAPLQLGTSYLVAMTYSTVKQPNGVYAGVIRLFQSPIGGGSTQPVATKMLPTIGKIAQGIHEDITVGPTTRGFDATVVDPAMTGMIDSVRLSNSLRYTDTAAPPTAKFASDGDTIALLNFDVHATHDTNVAYATRGYARGRTAWFPVRRTAEPNGTPARVLRKVQLHDFTLLSGGLFAMNAVQSRYNAFTIRYAPFGMVLDGDSAGSAFDDVQVISGNRAALAIANGGGSAYHNVMVGQALVPLVVAGGTKQMFTNLFVDTRGSVYGSFFIDAGVDIRGLYYDNEQNEVQWKGDMVIVNPSSFQLFKGEIDNPNQSLGQIDGTLPLPTPVIVDGGKGIRILGASFGLGNVKDAAGTPSPHFQPEVVYVNSPPQGKNVVVASTWSDRRVHLSNDTNPNTFESIGNGTTGTN